jgi:hypothetical protein
VRSTRLLRAYFTTATHLRTRNIDDSRVDPALPPSFSRAKSILVRSTRLLRAYFTTATHLRAPARFLPSLCSGSTPPFCSERPDAAVLHWPT